MATCVFEITNDIASRVRDCEWYGIMCSRSPTISHRVSEITQWYGTLCVKTTNPMALCLRSPMIWRCVFEIANNITSWSILTSPHPHGQASPYANHIFVVQFTSLFQSRVQFKVNYWLRCMFQPLNYAFIAECIMRGFSVKWLIKLTMNDSIWSHLQ